MMCDCQGSGSGLSISHVGRCKVMSTGLNTRDQYVALKSSISYPPSPRHSHDSDDSLRALEISEGPATNSQRIGRYILLPSPLEQWS